MESLPKERLEALIQELNTLEPLDVGRVLHELCEREAPTTPSEAAILRRAGVVPTLAVLLEPAWDNLIRLQACTLVARLCKNDPQVSWLGLSRWLAGSGRTRALLLVAHWSWGQECHCACEGRCRGTTL